MSRRRKKSSPVGLILLIVLLALLAVLIVLRAVSKEPENKSPEAEAPGKEETVLDLSATAVPALPTETPVPTSTPVPTPTPRPAVILENEGDLEIIIPDEMDSDGF